MEPDNITSDTEVDLCTNCDKPRAQHSVEYGEQLPFCSTNPNDGRRFSPKPDSTNATLDCPTPHCVIKYGTHYFERLYDQRGTLLGYEPDEAVAYDAWKAAHGQR